MTQPASRTEHASPGHPQRAEVQRMKAIVQDTYGSMDILELREIDRPVPTDNQVLVQVRAAGLHRGDWHVMTGLPYMIRLAVPTLGLRKPKVPVLGMDLAGRVESVGAHVTRFQPGDEVFGWTDGSFAEYAIAPADHLAAKPAILSFEEAADQYARIGSQPDEAAARLRAAGRLLEAGRPADAQRRPALAFYRRVGATAQLRPAKA